MVRAARSGGRRMLSRSLSGILWKFVTGARAASLAALRLRPSAYQVVDVDAKQDLSLRRGVGRRERVRVRRSKNLDRPIVVRAIRLAMRIQKVDRAVHDDAPPIGAASNLVDLERDPRMVLHHGQLRAWRRARVQPVLGEDVRNRLDVDAVVEAEREPPEAISRQQVERLVAAQLEERRRLARGGHASSRRTPRASACGMVNANSLPCPTALRTQIRPPCASTMPFAIDSPSPAPRWRAPSDDCQYRSKTRACLSGLIPGPLSVTENTTARSRDSALISIR